jgi:DnaJ-class molecular chaperone
MAYYDYRTARAEIPTIYLGDDTEVTLPWRWEICSTCSGNGHHSHRLGAISEETMWGDWDEQDREDYFAGAFDETCSVCDGSGKVRVVDETRCTKDMLKAYREQQEDDAEMRAIERAERLHCFGY